jgi:hypothetical protein
VLELELLLVVLTGLGSSLTSDPALLGLAATLAFESFVSSLLEGDAVWVTSFSNVCEAYLLTPIERRDRRLLGLAGIAGGIACGWPTTTGPLDRVGRRSIVRSEERPFKPLKTTNSRFGNAIFSIRSSPVVQRTQSQYEAVSCHA